jgi:hypothetical protein
MVLRLVIHRKEVWTGVDRGMDSSKLLIVLRLSTLSTLSNDIYMNTHARSTYVRTQARPTRAYGEGREKRSGQSGHIGYCVLRQRLTRVPTSSRPRPILW